MGLSMIQLKNAALESSAGKKSVHALRCLNVALPETGLVVLTGVSGSGKTALLHLLALRETPSRGEILIGGENTARWSEARRSAWLRECAAADEADKRRCALAYLLPRHARAQLGGDGLGCQQEHEHDHGARQAHDPGARKGARDGKEHIDLPKLTHKAHAREHRRGGDNGKRAQYAATHLIGNMADNERTHDTHHGGDGIGDVVLRKGNAQVADDQRLEQAHAVDENRVARGHDHEAGGHNEPAGEELTLLGHTAPY